MCSCACTSKITYSNADNIFIFSLKTNIGTASGSDFRAIAKEDITFNAQESKKTVSISLINDQVIEGNENFTVTLETTQPRVVFSRSQTTVTIQDNDGKM